MKLIDKDALVAEITHKIKVLEAFVKNFDGISDKVEKAKNKIEALGDALLFIDTLEVKEVNEVPATIMVNKYGNRFISSWSGLKEYDNFKEGQEIKIVIPKK